MFTSALIIYVCNEKNNINELRVSSDSELSFKCRVDYLKNKSFMKLVLIKFICIDFNNTPALRVFDSERSEVS
jgi:hypothetical protein